MANSENPDAARLHGVRRSVLDGLLVTVEAILGVATVKVGDLSQLAPGDTFKLDAPLGDPVELRLNGVTIAHGELVSFENRFAVRIKALAVD
jgi:flagellar motor switch protein FliN